jgi:hypothetical protein
VVEKLSALESRVSRGIISNFKFERVRAFAPHSPTTLSRRQNDDQTRYTRWTMKIQKGDVKVSTNDAQTKLQSYYRSLSRRQTL